MRQLTVTIPDDFYETFISFFKHVPEVSIDEKVENEIPLWQQEMVLERIKNTKPEDYIDANEALENLKKKYGF
ncbi:hypothetical protein [Flavobacterium hibisci]|uniref:hypothetical protein n=1 Tax=Flavobacterium hibisci TaxID=1914462 RepID=UPI001CC0BB76|nr:hypothetical protein [Flavobacterium hibisci]MBZ4043579.1 hypothetical protein [Flavobacterium hibisci]